MVRNLLRDATDWQYGLCMGLLFGVLFGVGLRYPMGESWTVALVSAGLAGPPFGLAMALVRRRERRSMERFRSIDLTPKQQRLAQRAAWRGPVPSDPAVREAAAELARVQVRRLVAWWFRLLAGLMFLVEVAALVLDVVAGDWSPGMVLKVAGALLFGFGLIGPRLLRKRLGVLEDVGTPRDS
jgi:hypothetical protein